MVTITTPTFANRVVQYPGRYVLNNVSGSTYDLVRSEGTVTVAGTPQNDATFNKIKTDLDNLNTNIGNIETDIGDVNDLDTTSKEVVGAINEVNTRLDTAETDIDNLQTGWLPAGETWTFASVDDPTGNISITGDVTSKYSAGMRIKFTNATNVIYGIITKVSYSSPNTTLTFLHEIDPTDSLALYLMQNSAITNNFVSCSKSPCGFPLNPNSWSIIFTGTTQITISNTLSFVTIPGISISVPIGLYKLSYNIVGQAGIAGGSAMNMSIITMINSTNTLNISSANVGGNSVFLRNSMANDLLVNLSSKTTYNLYVRGGFPGYSMYVLGTESPTILKAVCAYL